MALNFTTTREAAQTNGVKVLVYGKAGVGKTVLCATAPKPVIISAEAGLLSLQGSDIPVIEVKTIADLVEAYAWLTTDESSAQFETICLDSISEIGELALHDEKKKASDPRQAYGALIEKMTEIIRLFRDIPHKNIYFSAKETRIVDSATNVISYGPDMPGSKLGISMPYFFDEVFNLTTQRDSQGQPKRCLRTRATLQYEAKDRSGTLEEFEKADLTEIFEKIKKGQNNG